MWTVLVCVRTQFAARVLGESAARLGVSQAVRTAVTMTDALAQLSEAPADVVLVDPASVESDSATFSQSILAAAPGATIVFFGKKEQQAVATVRAAGARTVIWADNEEPVTALAEAVLLVLSKTSHGADVPLAAVHTATTRRAGWTGPLAAIPAGVVVPQQRSATGVPGRLELREFWQMVEASSLGTDGARQLRDLVAPTRSALVASRAGLGAGTPATRYLLGDFVAACYVGDQLDGSDTPLRQVQTLSRLLMQAGRRGEAAELWRLADAAGEPRAQEELDQVQATPRRRAELSPMETRVVQLMADGNSNAEIGRELHVSEDTVKAYARRVFYKFGARDRAHAVAAAFRQGLIT